MLQDAQELGDEYRLLEESDDFKTFSEMIDYDIGFPSARATAREGERLSTSDKAKRAMERISSRQYNPL